MRAFLTKSSLVILSLSLMLMESAKSQQRSPLIPDYAIGQYAGSIGYGSLGAGYELFKNKRGSFEFQAGLVPESKGGLLHILTGKFAYRPFKITAAEKLEIFPFNPGLFASYHLGEQFDIRFDRDQYGKDYYHWSTAIRLHASVSNEIRFYTGKKIKFITLYSEFNASDLYLVSLIYRKNSEYLSLGDVVKLGIGIKAGF